MSELVELRDKGRIEAFVRRDRALHIYALGDLDPFFWPHTRWFALSDSDDAAGELRALALLYTGAEPPVLLGFCRDDGGALARLLEELAPRLPARLYAHLSPGLVEHLGPRWSPIHHGRLLKMELQDRGALDEVDTAGVERLGSAHLDEILALYASSYPGNWFDPRMLETGQYFGIREAGELVCIAGIHVYSAQYGVAALGNITTATALRGRGLARRAVAGLCRSLLEEVEVVGLNVKADNRAAIACYERLGFVEIACYDEYELEPSGPR
jgi:predicted GNAT family acetyltransferase